MTDLRAQLIHIEVDRRLGHEWDEWDGRPLPNGAPGMNAAVSGFAFSRRTLCAEIFEAARQNKRVWRDDAHVPFEIIKSFGIHFLRIDLRE